MSCKKVLTGPPPALKMALCLLLAGACSPAASPPATTTRQGGSTGANGGTSGGTSGSPAPSNGSTGGTVTPIGGSGGVISDGGTSGGAGGAGGSSSVPDALGDTMTSSEVGGGGRETPPGMPPIADGTEYMKLSPYPLPPEASPGAGVPVGTIENHNEGGRGWTLYIPKQYDATKPAAFMVFQDGTLYGSRTGTYHGPTVLDNMIAKGELPVMLAAFIPPGGNRSVEYDTLSPAYSNFVINTIIPAVEAKYKITKNPEGRGIGGQSSGGIAAFTVAWERPDQFRRVLSDNGSYVSIRGGDKYPDVIRAAPVKPIRVTLLSSTNDLSAPRWLNGNIAMAAVLKEKGYQYIFMRGNGGHYPPVQAASVFPTHMKWLWFGYVPDGN